MEIPLEVGVEMAAITEPAFDQRPTPPAETVRVVTTRVVTTGSVDSAVVHGVLVLAGKLEYGRLSLFPRNLETGYGCTV